MDAREKELLKKLRTTFRIEADEHFKALRAALIELEQAPAPERQAEIVETAFREAHSLKGAARAVDMADIEFAARSVEQVFAALKRREIPCSPVLFDQLHQTVDRMAAYLVSVDAAGAEADRDPVVEASQRLEAIAQGAAPPPPTEMRPKATETPTPVLASPSPLPPAASATETLRIPTARLTSLFLQAEQLLAGKLAAEHQVADLVGIHHTLQQWGKKSARARMQSATASGAAGSKRLADFQELHEEYLKTIGARVAGLIKTSEQNSRALANAINNLLDDMKQVLMLPFSSVLEAFPKMVREIARAQGKEVDLVIQGGEIEIDKRILDEMKDPLIHLVRNSIDHGIEKPDERAQQGKPARGTIMLAISQHDSGKAEIRIADDGAGIAAESIRAAASRQGVVTREEAERMGDQEVLSLIYRSGITTSPIVTDLSGRGLGLSIVQSKAERLGGTVSFETRPGKRTTFTLVLPVALATARGVLVRLGEHLFMLPSTHVGQVVRTTKAHIRTVENQETIQVTGQVVSLVRLADVLALPDKDTAAGKTETMYAVLVGPPEKRIAFLVDEFIGEQEILLKRLGRQLARVRNIAGATILGTGRVVPVINPDDLLKSATRLPSAPAGGTSAAEAAASEPKSILVVEDSITSRTLLKNILETAGYTVETAVDGMDALARLRTNGFDIVVSDVDMPRLNGFDLTANIRGDNRLGEIPVVLVTALDSREDRERGIEVGANAYIVKSSFDQGNLLETIKRLA